MKEKTLNTIKFLIGWPLSLIALFFIGKVISPNISSVSSSITAIHIPFLLLGILFFLLYFLLRSLLWQILLFYSGHTLSLKETIYLWSISELKRFIPGNIWSLVGRTAAFSKTGLKKTVILKLIFVETEFLLLGAILISLIALPFVVHQFLPAFPHKELLISGIISVIFFGTATFIFNTFLLKKESSRIRHLFPAFSFRRNVYLLVLSTIILFLFGLGTYFSILSLFSLNQQYIFLLSSFFVFSYFIGYVSFVTPMGLGIREGVMTAGLSKFLPLNNAAVGSIFARIVVVVAELIFLGVAFILYKTKKMSFFSKQFLQMHWQEILVVFFLVAYVLYFTAASFLRYTNFYTGRFDLGNMDQTVWNTLHGRIFQLTDPDGTNVISRLAFHADFLLILLAPFYLIWQDPRMLLFIQTIVLSLGAVFIFLIAKKIFNKKTLALLFALAYLLNPSIQYSNLYDFHAVTLATTFFLAAYYFYLRQKYRLLVLFLFLAAITKEQVWVITAMFGIYMIIKSTKDVLFQQKERLFGIGIFLVSVILFYVIFFKAIPLTRGGNHFALAYYSDFGTTPTGIIKTLLFSPQKTLRVIFSLDRLDYIKEILLPMGFLSVFAPLYLLFTTPDLLINLLSNNPAFHQIYYQYTAVITPFFFLGAMYGVKNLKQFFPRVPIIVYLCWLLAGTAITAYFYGPLPGTKNPNIDMFVKPQPYRDIIDNFLSDIPQTYSIAATNNLGSHLSHRQKIFTVPIGIDKADIILFLLNDKFAAPSLKAQKQMASNMKQNKNYIEIFKTGDFVVFEKRSLYAHTEPELTKTKLYPLSIPTLQERDFVGGQVTIVNTVAKTKYFKSYIISYPSDGLTLYALMNVPAKQQPIQGFPVVIVTHGMIDSLPYDTEKSYAFVTDYFASHGFVVIKPDYRGNGKSDKDPTIFGILSYPIDVLNLVTSLPTIPQVDPQQVFFWGHGIGAEVALASLEVNNQNDNFPYKILGAAVWSPVIDPYRAYINFRNSSPQGRIPYRHAVATLGTPANNPLLWQSLSPLFYLGDITTPLQIMHGTSDASIPYSWSIELYNDLVSLNNQAHLHIYPHDNDLLSLSQNEALANNLSFFQKLLKMENLAN